MTKLHLGLPFSFEEIHYNLEIRHTPSALAHYQVNCQKEPNTFKGMFAEEIKISKP